MYLGPQSLISHIWEICEYRIAGNQFFMNVTFSVDVDLALCTFKSQAFTRSATMVTEDASATARLVADITEAIH